MEEFVLEMVTGDYLSSGLATSGTPRTDPEVPHTTTKVTDKPMIGASYEVIKKVE